MNSAAYPNLTQRQRLLAKSLDVLFVPLVAFVVLLKLQEVFNINFVLAAAAFIYLLKNLFLDRAAGARFELDALSISALAVALVEVVGYFQSAYRPNSFYQLEEVFFFLLFYLLLRLNLRWEYQRTAVFACVSLYGVALSCVCFVTFYLLWRRLREVGFRDVTDFRNYINALNPIGLSIGEWITVFLLFLPFPLALLVRFRGSRAGRWLAAACAVVLLLTLWLTFIRGVYLAVVAFLVVAPCLFYAYGLFPLKRVLKVELLIAGLSLLLMLPLAKPMLTTAALFKTTSQVRSFESRRHIWRDALPMVKDHWAFGVGGYNFPMRYLAYRSREDDSSFALRSFNFFLQVVIEKGVLGLLAYGLLIFTFYQASHRKVNDLGDDLYRKSAVVLFMAACAAVLVRDLSESSILVNRGVNVLLCVIFAHNARSES